MPTLFRSQTLSAPPVWRKPLVWAACAGACIEIVFLVATTIPLGIPGEWDWQRLPGGYLTLGTFLLGAVAILPASALYLAIAWWGRSRIESPNRVVRVGWLCALILAGFGWLWCVIDASADPIHRLGRGPVVLYHTAFSGYFLEAREPEDFSAALAEFEETMSEGDVLHIGTHPPGLTIAHRGLIEFFRASPALTDFALTTRPASVWATQQEILAPFPTPSGEPLAEADFAALWAATVLTMLAGALALIPLYFLVTSTAGREIGWMVACFWSLVPALSVFIPKSDTLLPVIATAAIAAWWPGSQRTIWKVVLASFLFWLGMLITLAMLTVGCLLLLLTIQEIALYERAKRKAAISRTLGNVLLAGTAFATLSLLFGLLTDVNLLDVWRWNYLNHARFYEVYDRTYWKWLLVNPIELAFAVGLPLLVVGAVRGRRLDWKAPPLFPVAATIALLWLSGKNSGEAARLWLFVMPWVLWAMAPIWRDLKKSVWFCVLVLQIVTAFVVASSVSGFEFQRFLRGGG